jgi:hypothetical protein
MSAEGAGIRDLKRGDSVTVGGEEGWEIGGTYYLGGLRVVQKFFDGPVRSIELFRSRLGVNGGPKDTPIEATPG